MGTAAEPQHEMSPKPEKVKVEVAISACPPRRAWERSAVTLQDADLEATQPPRAVHEDATVLEQCSGPTEKPAWQQSLC